MRANAGRSVTSTATEDKRKAVVRETESGTAAEQVFACHCGKVQAELLVPIKDQELKEDNCSTCVRVSDSVQIPTYTIYLLDAYRLDISGYIQPKTKSGSMGENILSSILLAASLEVQYSAKLAEFMCLQISTDLRSAYLTNCLRRERRQL
jgi:hypothetical protein